jgi:hypothetical protein
MLVLEPSVCIPYSCEVKNVHMQRYSYFTTVNIEYGWNGVRLWEPYEYNTDMR